MKFTRDIFSRFSEMKLLTLMVSLFMMAQASDELREFHKSGEDSRNLRSLEPSSKVFRQAEETFPSVPAADQRRQADEKKRANYLPDYDVFPTPFIPDFLPHSKAVRQAEETAAEKTKAEDPNKLGEKSRNLRSLGLPESQLKWRRQEKTAKNAESLKDLSSMKKAKTRRQNQVPQPPDGCVDAECKCPPGTTGIQPFCQPAEPMSGKRNAQTRQEEETCSDLYQQCQETSQCCYGLDCISFRCKALWIGKKEEETKRK